MHTTLNYAFLSLNANKKAIEAAYENLQPGIYLFTCISNNFSIIFAGVFQCYFNLKDLYSAYILSLFTLDF